VKLGMAPVQREGMEYGFTVFFDIDQAHNARASKDRTNLFKGEIFTPDEKIGERILGRLSSARKRRRKNSPGRRARYCTASGWRHKWTGTAGRV
jgi:hypothetical protein